MSGPKPYVQDVFLNTENRNSGVNYNAAWVMDPRTIKSMDSGFDMALMAVNFKNLQYPTNSYNNRIYFEEKSSGTIKTATIPAGSYDISGYLLYVKAALEAASQYTLTYTLVYDQYTDRITISTTQNFRFIYGATTTPYHAYNQLGLDLANQANGTATTSWQMAYPFNISSTADVLVATNLSLGNYCSDHQSNILATIAGDVGYGDTISWSTPAPNPISVGQAGLDYIELALFDEYGHLYLLPANVVVNYWIRIYNRVTHPTPQFTYV